MHVRTGLDAQRPLRDVKRLDESFTRGRIKIEEISSDCWLESDVEPIKRVS